MQGTYINTLYDLMEKDKRVLSCLSDSGTDYDMILARDFPDRCLNFGIAEENKIGAASGLAALGKIPFVYTQSPFLTYRGYEFIRNDICFQNRNVKLIGIGSGLSISQLGPSHHSSEDIAVLSVLPNLIIFSPATPSELSKCLQEAYEIEGPVFIRMGMNETEELQTELYNSEDDSNAIDKAISVIEDKKPSILLITTGAIVFEALEAVRRLQSEDGLHVMLLHLPVIKPFDNSGVLHAIRVVEKVFTVEEHNVIGGIGSLVAAAMAECGDIKAHLTRIGLNDCFAKGYGTYKQVLKANGLDSESIYAKIVNNN